MEQNKMSKTEIVKRSLFLIAGLMIMAFGVAFSIVADLGTSPISSLPYVTSLITPLSVGQATICMHIAFISAQIVILRRNYKPIQLFQLPVAFIFGYMTDFAVWVLKDVEYSSYFQQWIFCIIGILLVAVGVSMEVTAKVVTLAGEGVVLALCQVMPIKFGNMKVAFDVSLVAISIVLSFVYLASLQGVREGTIAAAVFVGLAVKIFNRYMKKVETKFLDKQ